MKSAGGSPAAGHLSCAAKKGNRKKAAPGVAPRVHGVPLRCLPRWGDCATRPGEAHKTCLTAGLGQCSSTPPDRVELLGAPQGEQERSRAYGFYSVLSPALTPSRPSRRHARHGATQHSVRSTQHALFPFLFSLASFLCHGFTTQRRLTQVATGSGFVTQAPAARPFFCASSCTKLYSAIFVSSAAFSAETPG